VTAPEPLWLQRAWVDALHFQQLKRFGGLYGIRDDGAIESALARARNQWEYAEDRDIAALGAAYGFGLTRSHGYSDGNKRVGFVAMAVFLELNGWELDAPEAEVVRMMLAVAANEASELDLTGWVRQHLLPSSLPDG
jgi:death on curing protein